MPFVLLVWICFAVYAFSNFLLLPLFKKRWNATRKVSKVTRAGTIAIVELLRNVAFATTAAYTGMALLVFVTGLTWGNNVTLLEKLIDFAQRDYKALKGIQKVGDEITFWIVVLLVTMIVFRRFRKKLVSRYERRLLEELQKLHRERLADPNNWEQAATPEIEALRERMRACVEEAKTLSSGNLDAKQLEHRRALLIEMRKLEEQLATAEWQRRVDLSETDEPAPHKERWWSRAFGVLVSKGFFSDLKLGLKMLSRLATAAFALGLVGLAAPDFTATLRARILNLDDLRVSATRKKVLENWKQGTAQKAPPQPKPQLPKPPAPPAISPNDAQAARYLVEQIGRALARNSHWGGARETSEDTAQALRHEATVHDIREKVSLPREDGGMHPSMAEDFSHLDGVEREAYSHMREPVGTGKASNMGQQFTHTEDESHIVSWFGERWQRVKSEVAFHAAQYNEPMAYSDVRSAVVDRIMGRFASPADPDSALAKLLFDSVKDFDKKIIGETIDIEFRSALLDLAEGKHLNDVLHHVETKPLAISMREGEKLALFMKNLPDDGKLAADLRSAAQPAPNAASTNAGTEPDYARADRAARDVADIFTGDGERPLTEDALDAMADYDHHFPKGGGGGGNSGSHLSEFLSKYSSSGRSVRLANTLFKAERAASFSMMRGYARVGGVLFGQEADPDSEKLDFRDLRWQINGRSVSLWFKRGDGREVMFGPVDRSLVHQALAFVVDGRVLAVTMTTARPLRELKVLLHPALVDTPLGSRVVDLDRWVDTYAGRNYSERQIAEDAVNAQRGLYELATAARFLGLITHEKVRLESLGSGSETLTYLVRLTEWEGEAKAVIRSSELRTSATAALRSKSIDASGLFQAKPEFFDSKLVEQMGICAKEGDLTATLNCITARAKEEAESASKSEKESWTAQAPTFQIWSGVRELPFRLDRNLAFLTGDGKSRADSLWPMDFMLQVAFTSAPAFGASDARSIEYTDTKPFEFPQLQEGIRRRVAQEVNHPSADSTTRYYSDLRNFVLLQRVFRVALSGRLGSQFPVEKLASLTSATAGGIPYCHTPRWNPRPGILEFSFSQRLEDAGKLLGSMGGTSPATAQLAARARQCAALVSRAGSDYRRLAAIPVAEWNAVCKFEALDQPLRQECSSAKSDAACMAAGLTRSSRYTAAAREMRAALKVDVDERPAGFCAALSTDSTPANTRSAAAGSGGLR